MKAIDDYMTDLDQDLADATKALRDAERLVWRGRRRLLALMGLARTLGLRSDEPKPPVWADLAGQGYADMNFIRDRDKAAAVADRWLNQVHRPLSGVSGYTEQVKPGDQPLFFSGPEGQRATDVLDLLALGGIDVRQAAKPHLERLKIDMPPNWPRPIPPAPDVHHHQNCRCSTDPIPPKKAAKGRGRKRR